MKIPNLLFQKKHPTEEKYESYYENQSNNRVICDVEIHMVPDTKTQICTADVINNNCGHIKNPDTDAHAYNSEEKHNHEKNYNNNCNTQIYYNKAHVEYYQFNDFNKSPTRYQQKYEKDII